MFQAFVYIYQLSCSRESIMNHCSDTSVYFYPDPQYWNISDIDFFGVYEEDSETFDRFKLYQTVYDFDGGFKGIDS